MTNSLCENTQLHFYYADVISRALHTICAKIASDYSNNLAKDESHFYSLISACYDLFNLILSDPQILQGNNLTQSL